MFNAGVPAANFFWQDLSGAQTPVLFSASDGGLCVPFQFIFAERGPVGQVEFGAAKELYSLFGSTSFDPASPYFTPAAQFVGTAMGGQGVNVMRLVDPTATVATLGLFITVTPGPLIQYQKDSNGARILDNSGNPKPILNGSNQPTTEPGVTVRWSVRALAPNESISTLTTTTTSGATTYPVMAFNMLSPGAYGNRQGFSLYSSGSALSSVANDVNSILYRFVPYELPTNVSTTASTISDYLGNSYSDFSFKDIAIYSKTQTNYAMKYILGNNYVDQDTFDSLLPYDVYTYGANIAAVGAAVLAVSPELEGTDPYLIDLISGQDLDGVYYDHLAVDPTSSTVVSSDVKQYALGGSDGDTSFANLQTLITAFCNSSDQGDFGDILRHPMTHFSDPGFTMATKYAIMNLLDVRDSIKLDISTQDASQPLNTKAQDLSAAQMLNFRAQMHPESTLTGVGCCRVGIYAHAGQLVSGTPYTGNIPFTLNRLVQRRDLDGGNIIRGSSGGQPNSIVTIFRKPNWAADDISVRSSFWATACNTVMYSSRKVFFYPSLRTVYPNDTSLLSDDEVSDRVIYIMKIAREKWAQWVGTRADPTDLFPQIEKDINDTVANAMGRDNIKVKATVFKTPVDSNLGYAFSVNLAITGNLPVRQINFNLILQRATA